MVVRYTWTTSWSDKLRPLADWTHLKHWLVRLKYTTGWLDHLLVRVIWTPDLLDSPRPINGYTNLDQWLITHPKGVALSVLLD